MNRQDFGTLKTSARCLACSCLDLNAPDTPSMRPARESIETPLATRMRSNSYWTITPDAAIFRNSRAYSAIRQIILRRLMCVRGL